ncbi:MAG: urea carboxylase-associated family protein [Actinobacteria bacterium]|nr:urea carboxylase-associated family protein [Actinomycetota bacterium]
MRRELLREVVVPAREARTIEVEAGQVLAVVDLEGRQVGDLAAWLRDPREYLSPGHTLSCLTKLVPEVGDEIFSNHRTPLLRIVRDDVGRHDLIVPCCDPERYSRDYGLADHPSCLASLQRALAADGRDLPLEGEQCWNVFMNNRHEDGRIVTHEPEHGAGATIEMEALADLVVALSACPQDLSPCNAFDPTPMALRVYGES